MTVPGGTGEPMALGTPAKGVYLYDTKGFEEVSVLGGSRHAYPAETTTTVVATACGADVRWDGLEQRWDAWTTCHRDRAVELRSLETFHEFFSQVDRRVYECSAGTVFKPESEVPGTTFSGRCSSEEAVAEISGRVIGTENLTVSGAAVEAVRVRLDEVLTGATKGTRTSESWYRASDGLLLLRTSLTDADTKATFGYTHYREELALSLKSATPRR